MMLGGERLLRGYEFIREEDGVLGHNGGQKSHDLLKEP